MRVICMDMWAAYANLVKEHAPQAQILFDRFHIVKHLNESVEQVRRSEMRRLSQKEKVPFKRSRWLLLPELCTQSTSSVGPVGLLPFVAEEDSSVFRCSITS